MNETNLIARLQQNIRIGENCPNGGTNLYINLPNADEMAKDVKKAFNKSKQNYEMVNHPKHYNNYDVEVVDMMEKIWGTKATMEWCKMTAYKYRMRMGTKPSDNNNNPEEMKNKLMEDFKKEQWYLEKAKYLNSKLNNN